MHGLKPSLAVLVVCILIVGTASYLFYTLQLRTPTLQGVVDSVDANDPRAALLSADELLQSSASEEERAQAIILTALISYSLTGGDHDEASRYVAALKDIAVNPSFRSLTRAYALNTLAMLWDHSNGDTKIFEVIFSSEPFRSYVVTNETTGKTRMNSSIIGLYKTSYEEATTSIAAVSVASHAVSDIFARPNIASSTRAKRLEDAKVFLDLADTAVRGEKVSYPGYERRYIYGQYLNRRAYTIGGLAYFLGGGYSEGYRRAYDTAIASIAASDTDSISGLLPHVRWYYAAYVLMNENDVDTARVQLNALMQYVTQHPTTGFSDFIKAVKRDPSRELLSWLNRTLAVSPEFRAYVDGIQ